MVSVNSTGSWGINHRRALQQTLQNNVISQPSPQEGKYEEEYLRNNRHLLAQVVEPELRGQYSVHVDLPLRFCQAEQGRHQGALPSTGSPHHAHLKDTWQAQTVTLRISTGSSLDVAELWPAVKPICPTFSLGRNVVFMLRRTTVLSSL